MGKWRNAKAGVKLAELANRQAILDPASKCEKDKVVHAQEAVWKLCVTGMLLDHSAT